MYFVFRIYPDYYEEIKMPISLTKIEKKIQVSVTRIFYENIFDYINVCLSQLMLN